MDNIFEFVVFTIVSTGTPGPNNIMIMTSGLNHGVRRSLPHYLGICLGFPPMVCLVAIGLGTVFSVYPSSHKIIKIVGVSYLLLLAWKIAQMEVRSTDTDRSNTINEGQKGQPFTFIQAALFQWVNPKAWVMAVSAFSVYVSVDHSMVIQVLIITLIFSLVSFPNVGMWLVFGVLLQTMIKNKVQRRIFNWTMAILLVASIVPIIPSIFV